MFEISYEERYLPKLLTILRINNAVYKLNRKKKKIKILFCSLRCKNEVELFLIKHQTCDLCSKHYAKYIVRHDRKTFKVCSFCLKENNYDGRPIRIELHHDIVTGLLRACP